MATPMTDAKTTTLTPERLTNAENALRWVFPDLVFGRSQITPESAAYAFQAMRKVDAGSRVAWALFQAVKLPTSVREWSDIPDQLWDAISEALANPGKSVKCRIALALIVFQHARLMQQHLRDPETFPCPEFDKLSLW